MIHCFKKKKRKTQADNVKDCFKNSIHQTNMSETCLSMIKGETKPQHKHDQNKITAKNTSLILQPM